MCLLGRALELGGVPATMVTWRDAIARLVKPPRVALTRLPRGAPLGTPNDAAQQRRVLEATLGLLSKPAPVAPLVLHEVLTSA